jgi:hypothetical protein
MEEVLLNVRISDVWPFYVVGVLAVVGLALGEATTAGNTERERDGLVGPVHQVVSTTEATTATRTYSRDGVLLEAVTRDAPPRDQPDLGERTQRVVYAHDIHGRRIREMIDEGDGQPYLSRAYAYDDGGKMVAEALYNMCGTFSSLTLYSYDGAGRLREDLSYRLRSLYKRTYELDSHGRTAARKNYKNDKLLSFTGYRYDAQGRLIGQSEHRPDGELESAATYQYDQKGNQTLEEVTNPADSSLNGAAASTYEFDARGNWITRTVRRHGGSPDDGGKMQDAAADVTRRAITYYGNASE